MLGELTGLIDRVVAEAEGEGLWPAGLAVAVPGLVARDARTVVRAPNLGWLDTDLGPLLPGKLPLTVANEANFGALAELWLGADTPRDFLHVSAEIGIGAAVVVDGRVLHGNRGFAGELGHVPVWPDGPPCACGGRGCLEQYAGEDAVLRAAGLESGEDRVGLLAGRAEQGDAAVRRALHDAGTALGIALTGAVNLLDPENVVLGGALSGLSPWLLPLAPLGAGPAYGGPALPGLRVRPGPGGGRCWAPPTRWCEASWTTRRRWRNGAESLRGRPWATSPPRGPPQRCAAVRPPGPRAHGRRPLTMSAVAVRPLWIVGAMLVLAR